MSRKYPAPQSKPAENREADGWDYHAERIRQLPPATTFAERAKHADSEVSRLWKPVRKVRLT